MPRDFLPPPSPGTSYPVTPSTGRFAEGDAQLLSKIGANMAVSEAQTEGRVPSPLSRAYMFYTALFGRSLAMAGNQSDDDEDRLATAGRIKLHAQARATFRGLCAVFALRDALDLDVQLRAVPLVQTADPIARVLVPNLNGAPGGAAYWQHVRLFTVRSRAGGPAEVLAGLSPLTGLFPAANPPARALSGVYWYAPPSEHAPTGTWFDPTGPTPTGGVTPLSVQTTSVVRAALAEWVRHTLAGFDIERMTALGVERKGAQLLRDELKAWNDDLSAAPPMPGVGVQQGTLDATVGHEVPPFLLGVCAGVGEAVLSDLPMHNGRLVVSSGALADPTLRLWGSLFGDRSLRDRAAALPPSGDNLGAALGLGEAAAPVPFVVLDRMFTPRFTRITRSEVSPEWRALAVRNGDATEYALFPFRPEILELLTPEELAEAATAELSQDTLHFRVRLRVGSQEVNQLYATNGEGDYALDLEVSPDALDLRLFPDFDLSAVRNVLPTDATGAHPDETYFARVRLGPTWSFRVHAFHLDALEDGRSRVTQAGSSARRGTTTSTSHGAVPPGEADFFTLDRKPDGFWFEDRGICLIHLLPPASAGGNEQNWTIGVDFGTSNSCVAYRPTNAEAAVPAQPLGFPIMTSSLLKTPQYGAMGEVNEGHSAVADFFFRLSSNEGDLVSPPKYPQAATPYFPTQIITQQKELPAGANAFDLSAGLILFQNGFLTGTAIVELLEGFRSHGAGPKISKRFSLKQDIKWGNSAWLVAFMSHLRLQIILTAARENARVTGALFSYPKAFNDQQEQAYEKTLRMVWADLFMDLRSESEAVRTTLGGTANQHLVLDIGGGTTDLIGFEKGNAVFQTSFKLASGHVNDYVVASPAFRRAFQKAVEEGAEDIASDLFAEGSKPQLLNVWIGLLQSIEYQDTSGRALTYVTSALAEAARGDDEEARAVRGFFLTVAILFGGLAYSAGRLQGLSSTGRLGAEASRLSGVRIALTGNGSKLINLLSSARVPFNNVFEHLFRAGLTADGDAAPPKAATVSVDFDGVYKLEDGTSAPKTTVALGLLAVASSDDGGEIPVANVVLESGPEAAVDESPDPAADASPETAVDGSLVAFYASIAEGTSSFDPSAGVPRELGRMLDALNEALPNGHNGKRMVIPGMAPNWHEPLKTSTFARAEPILLDRLSRNAATLPAGAQTAAGAAYVSALEPLLVAEIAALLDQIRIDYATS